MVSSGDVKAELPTALDSSHQSKLDKLKSLKGADFSSLYESDQRPQGRRVVVRTLRQERRQSEIEGLGGQDPSGSATPVGDGRDVGGGTNHRKALIAEFDHDSGRLGVRNS